MRPRKRLGRRLEEVPKAVGGGCCGLQMPLSLAFAVRETVAGHRLGALEGGGGVAPPSNTYLPPPPQEQVTGVSHYSRLQQTAPLAPTPVPALAEASHPVIPRPRSVSVKTVMLTPGRTYVGAF